MPEAQYGGGSRADIGVTISGRVIGAVEVIDQHEPSPRAIEEQEKLAFAYYRLLNVPKPPKRRSISPNPPKRWVSRCAEGVRKCSCPSGIMAFETGNRPQARSTQKMLADDHPDRIQIAFDDHRLVNNAGLILPATLALHLGLPQWRSHQSRPPAGLGRRAQHTSPARPPSPPRIHPLPWGYTTAASATAGGRFFEPQPHRLMGQGFHHPQLHHSVGQKMQGPVVVAIGRWAARQGDQVGLPLVIKLPVSVGLDPVLQHAIQTFRAYRRLARYTVPLEMSKAAATCGAFHPASTFSRVRARAMMRAELLPLRISWLSRSRSSGVNCTAYCSRAMFTIPLHHSILQSA